MASPTDFNAAAFLKNVTSQPGVYQMFDKQDQVIYIGKARNLKKRISSYFSAQVKSPKTNAMLQHVCDIKVMITENDHDALILENNLIKQYKPKYNILFRDDKSYPYIFLSDDEYPRLDLYRGKKKVGGHYYGPYPSGLAVRDTLNLLQKLFHIRSCQNTVFQNRTRPCLQYQMNRCTAPCVKFISPENYQNDIRSAKLFLEGKNKDIQNMLIARMEQAVTIENFEAAAFYRDHVRSLQQVQTISTVESQDLNVDVLSILEKGDLILVYVLLIRGGRVLGDKHFIKKIKVEMDLAEVLTSFILQYYSEQSENDLPDEWILPRDLPEQAYVEHFLQQQSKRKIDVRTHVKTIRALWQTMAQQNAEQALAHAVAKKLHYENRWQALMHALNIPLFKRMECFDISHHGGEATIASCVVFDATGPLKKDYRRFNLHDIKACDDYAAINQAVSRRYYGSLAEMPMPDLLIIDGGRGQLHAAQKALDNLDRQFILLGIAKGPDRKPGLETIWRLYPNGEFTTISVEAPALALLQHIRDEAHRFAITGQRKKLSHKRHQSFLETIPGIGAKKRQQILQHFGGLSAVKNASVQELMQVSGINQALAEKIFATLR